MEKSKNVMVSLVVLVVIGLGISYWVLRGTPSSDPNTAAVINGLDQGDNSLENKLLVNDQFPGAIVYLSSITLTRGGWVVIRNEVNSLAGEIIGTEYFNQGIDTGVVNLTEPTKEGLYYYATLYGDNGDKVFEPTIDLPLKNNGEEITVRFFATQNLPEIKG